MSNPERRQSHRDAWWEEHKTIGDKFLYTGEWDEWCSQLASKLGSKVEDVHDSDISESRYLKVGGYDRILRNTPPAMQESMKTTTVRIAYHGMSSATSHRVEVGIQVYFYQHRMETVLIRYRNFDNRGIKTIRIHGPMRDNLDQIAKHILQYRRDRLKFIRDTHSPTPKFKPGKRNSRAPKRYVRNNKVDYDG